MPSPDIFFHRQGRQYSHVPRDRGTEAGNRSLSTEERFQEELSQQARTAYYVVLANRLGISPESPQRAIRDIFVRQEAIVGTIPLSHDGAILDVVGRTTGPYAAGEDEYHGLLLVTGKRD
ncbi:MAG: hypothetical protein N3A54_07140, partial [Patescibacteria group bacterium]|nr:hypothetical protein [Patescibacteria group bacterium]